MNLLLPPGTAMVMGSDRRLIHTGDHRRAKRRADGRGHVSLTENDAFTRESIHVGCVHQFLSLKTKVTGHVINHDPDDIGSVSSLRRHDIE